MEKLSEVFPEGSPFRLLIATDEGVQDTAYGASAQASLIVEAPDGEGGQRHFRVWGALAEQVAQMEADDLPALVFVKKEGKRNSFSLVEKLTIDDDGVASARIAADDDIPF